MDKLALNIIGLAESESNPVNFVIILEEREGFRRLPIIIGAFEAQAIAVELEQMQPPRPLTHDLIKSIMTHDDITLKEIVIHEKIANFYHAELVLKKEEQTWRIDARTSDALALAVRFAAPIYASKKVMDENGVVLDSPSKSFTNKRGKLQDYSIEELEKLLQQVLEKEDFESASKIRDAIAIKKSG